MQSQESMDVTLGSETNVQTEYKHLDVNFIAIRPMILNN